MSRFFDALTRLCSPARLLFLSLFPIKFRFRLHENFMYGPAFLRVGGTRPFKQRDSDY